MEVRTYRASSMMEALSLVRCDLGPEAAVLHTREVQGRRMFGLLSGKREIEVTASAGVNVPSRMPQLAASQTESLPEPHANCEDIEQDEPDVPDQFQGQLAHLQSMVQELCRRSSSGRGHDLPEELFHLFTDLIDSELSEELARELVERLRLAAPGADLSDPIMAKARLSRMIEDDIQVSGPIKLTPGRCRVVALVGPTGVGKTTTIAKLAANYRLKEKRKVGLITVDTYRVAAIEQLRTYADIIDLPMKVVSSPRQMREAVRGMEDLDLILMDTAGRSPKDEVKILELKSFLSEARADEVHLVLSSVTGANTLEQTAKHFAVVGTTSLVLTKLDEATGLGTILPVLRSSKLPLSYLTNGQNVPDDIEMADPHRVAKLILGVEQALMV
jgi:flagellar biosynthesis protein FlhF